MPIQVSEHTLTAESPAFFAQVLRDDADAREALTQALSDPDQLAYQAIFNGRPVGLLLLRASGGRQQPVTLVVHPATRGRGVGTAFARQAGERLGESLALTAACRDFATRAGLAG